VPSYGERSSATVEATPEACFDALTDYERLPEWQSAVCAVRVLERDEEGRGCVVEYEVDARVRRVRYTLRQIHERPRRLGSEYVGGDFRDFAGEWRFTPAGDGRTEVELDVRLDPGRFVPGPVRKLIARAVIRGALSDLRARFA
jgi:ribosome-associated toxin RatA of RatAB toxin-antitoxin module